jgi:hypothetical protein
MKRLLKHGLFASIAMALVVLGLASPSTAARSTTDKVTSGSWGQGVAVVDPTVPANDVTPSDYAAVNLKVTLTNPGLTWDNGPNNVIAGCSAPACVPNVMNPGVYKFPFVAGTGGNVANVGGHFNLHGTDSRGRAVSISLTIQTDVGFANLPAWAVQGDQVTTGTWGEGVAVVDPTVPANDVTPSDYAAINLSVTLTDPTLSWDNGPNNVIGGCGAPGCLPTVMTPGVYKFPYVAGTGGIVADVGGHFNLQGTDAKGRSVSISLTIQADPGFALLPSWATP